MRKAVAGMTILDLMRQGRRIRAYMDVLVACPG